MRCTIRFIAAFGATLVVICQSQATWSIRKLGLLPGTAMYSQTENISGDGHTAIGFCFTAGALPNIGVKWTPETGINLLLPSAEVLSYDGSYVAGGYGAPPDMLYRWSSASGIVPISFATNQFDAESKAMSSDGQTIAGTLQQTSSGYKGFYWTPGGGVTVLPLYSSYTNLYIEGMSADASLFAGFALTPNSGGFLPITWSPVTGFQPLPVPSGTFITGYAAAFGMSGDGSVVVGHCWDPNTMATGLVKACIWINGTLTDIDNIGGWHYLGSHAWDASYDGTVVVGSYTNSSVQNAAFRWDSASGMVDLKAWLQSTGTQGLSQWQSLYEARAVSDDGNTIVGWGYDSNGVGSGFIATNSVVADPVQPDAETIVTGTHVSGGFPQLFADDSDKLVISDSGSIAGPRERMRVEVTGHTSLTSASSIDISIDSSVTSGLVINEAIQAWDYTAGAWVSVGSRGVSGTDSSTQYTLATSPSRFIDPSTGALKISAAYSFGTTTFSTWNVNIDNVRWIVHP